MITEAGQNEIKSKIVGTSQPKLPIYGVQDIKIPVPPLKEQNEIVATLSSLDDKIEVNNRINKTLEDMAQAIFKRWFVDFEFPNEDGEPYMSSGGEMIESELGMIPKGWEVKGLGEITKLVKQSARPGEHLSDRRYNPIDTLPMNSIAITDSKSYKEALSSLILFEKYDILLGAMRVYFHRVSISPYAGVTRNTTFVIRSKELSDVSYNLFLINQESTIEFASNTSKGSTMPYAVWDNGLANLRLAYPPEIIRKQYNAIIFPGIRLIISHTRQNKILESIRDALLPKLMSGEIRVPIEEM